MALGPLGEAGAAQGDALVDGAAFADFGGLADDHAHAVVDEDTRRDARARMDLDAGQPTAQVRREAAQPGQSMRPAPVGTPMDGQRMQARVASQHLPGVARGGVAFEDDPDVGFETVEHGGVEARADRVRREMQV